MNKKRLNGLGPTQGLSVKEYRVANILLNTRITGSLKSSETGEQLTVALTGEFQTEVQISSVCFLCAKSKIYD